MDRSNPGIHPYSISPRFNSPFINATVDPRRADHGNTPVKNALFRSPRPDPASLETGIEPLECPRSLPPAPPTLAEPTHPALLFTASSRPLEPSRSSLPVTFTSPSHPIQPDSPSHRALPIPSLHPAFSPPSPPPPDPSPFDSLPSTTRSIPPPGFIPPSPHPTPRDRSPSPGRGSIQAPISPCRLDRRSRDLPPEQTTHQIIPTPSRQPVLPCPSSPFPIPRPPPATRRGFASRDRIHHPTNGWSTSSFPFFPVPPIPCHRSLPRVPNSVFVPLSFYNEIGCPVAPSRSRDPAPGGGDVVPGGWSASRGGAGNPLGEG